MESLRRYKHFLVLVVFMGTFTNRTDPSGPDGMGPSLDQVGEVSSASQQFTQTTDVQDRDQQQREEARELRRKQMRESEDYKIERYGNDRGQGYAPNLDGQGVPGPGEYP